MTRAYRLAFDLLCGVMIPVVDHLFVIVYYLIIYYLAVLGVRQIAENITHLFVCLSLYLKSGHITYLFGSALIAFIDRYLPYIHIIID